MRREDISRLVSVDGGYRLVIEPGELDATRFDNELRQGREAAADDPHAAAVHLREALHEWRGNPFGVIDGIDAIDMTRSYLNQRRAELLDQLALVELAAGRHHELIADIRRWCAEFPDSESLHTSLVIAQYRAGDPVGALESCRAFARRFDEDY